MENTAIKKYSYIEYNVVINYFNSRGEYIKGLKADFMIALNKKIRNH